MPDGLSMGNSTAEYMASIAEHDNKLTAASGSMPLDLGAAEGVNLYAFGHSYVVGNGASSTASRWLNRLAAKLNATIIDRSVSGTHTNDTAGVIFGGRTSPVEPAWVLGSKGLVVIQTVLNDIRRNGLSAAGQADVTYSLDALLSMLAAASVKQQNDASFVYSGTWTQNSAYNPASGNAISFTQTQNSQVTISWTGPSISVYGYVSGSLGPATVSYTLDGSLVKTVPYNAVTSFGQGNAPYVETFSGLTNTPHTLVIKKVDAGSGPFYVDCVTFPSTTPPSVLLLKESYLADWSQGAPYSQGSDAACDAYNAIIASIGAKYPNVTVVDPSSVWDKASMIYSTDLIHPNDKGHAALAKVMAQAAFALPYSGGLGTI